MNRDAKELGGRYAIVGVGEAGMGKAQPGDTALSLQCQAAREAILDAGLRSATSNQLEMVPTRTWQIG